MQHAPLNTAIAISSAALGSLYLQTLSMFVILLVYYVVFSPFVIDDPVGAFLMFLLAWFTGCAVGLLMFAIKPWAPTFTTVLRSLYQRANMIASGKMFVANSLPSFMLAMFDWNPLFHTIDQARGFAFINYNPHNSSIIYPINVGIALMTLGLIVNTTPAKGHLRAGARRTSLKLTAIIGIFVKFYASKVWQRLQAPNSLTIYTQRRSCA